MDIRGARQKVVDWTRKTLVGPGGSSDFEFRGLRPSELFQCGVLYPRSADTQDPSTVQTEADFTAVDPVAANETESDSEATVPLPRYVPPSSVGFSFYIEREGEECGVLDIECGAVIYEKSIAGDSREVVWRRRTLNDSSRPWNCDILDSGMQRRDVLRDRAELSLLVRPHGAGHIVTLSLTNRERLERVEDFSSVRAWTEAREEQCLFEVRLECHVRAGRVGDYPSVPANLLGEEEQELALQYRDVKVLAIGHGAAADWGVEGGAMKLWAEFMPAVEVPQLTADTAGAGSRALDIEFLAATADSCSSACVELRIFVADYAKWAADQREDATKVPSAYQDASERLLIRIERVLDRMREGIDLIERDAGVARAFAVAHRAMALQMRQGDRRDGRAPRTPRWRPFQLGFLLATLASALDASHRDRDSVDLIWFPTGGGKTEAYLALMACVIARRREMFAAAGSGTAAWMRYTLRLLTAQQFERATRLILAMEHLRRTQPDLNLGTEAISIGLWVGGTTTPNTFRDALTVVQGADGGPSDRFVLTRCPWCGQPLQQRAAINSFAFQCTDSQCEFGAGKGPLPCQVVDEGLYHLPPTLLVATLDKFARFTWEPRCAAFLGGVSQQRRPPELIIQDELHLIAGPLGSIAGVYEAALDVALEARGMRPKYIASTATIRSAAAQVRNLYAREACLFPPGGLDHRDSWFARSVPLDERPGRLFVGYLAAGRQQAKAIAPLAASLTVAPVQLFAEDVDRDALLDAWWTLVSYHSSLRGLGQAYGVLRSDMHEHLRVLQEAYPLYSMPTPAVVEAAWKRRQVGDRMRQLSSRVDAAGNQQTFAQMGLHWSDARCLDSVVSTNMISVGVDVSRLGLMIVNGQPMTTAEYIQASSRVGRAEVPGLVYANYYRQQARSLSHYENFRAYHDALYRHVEPTSVTPFSQPSRHKALHAALVIVMRHGAGLLDSADVAKFDPRPGTPQRKWIDALARRCARADSTRAEVTRDHLARLEREWLALLEQSRGQIMVQYSQNDQNSGIECLLGDAEGKRSGQWRTLNSMRDVERSALLEVR